jgi:hypothetical protein
VVGGRPFCCARRIQNRTSREVRKECQHRILAALPAGGIPNRDQDRHIMIKTVRGNITNLRVNFVGSRPATKSLAAAATLGYTLHLARLPAVSSLGGFRAELAVPSIMRPASETPH